MNIPFVLQCDPRSDRSRKHFSEELRAAFGNGGQRLFVLPDLDLVVVVTAANYNQPDQWRTPLAVLNQFMLPALAAARAS